MRSLGLGLVCAILGCSSLAVRANDPAALRTLKYVVRLPLSLLTLSASEYRIQAIESGSDFERYVGRQRRAIEAARAAAADAETYTEYRDWIDYAKALEAELEQRIAERRAADLVGVEVIDREPAPSPPVPTPDCRSRRDGDRVVTECE